VPYTVKAAWQNVDQETADELVGEEGHDLLPVSASAAVILVAERDLIAVEGDEAAVGDGDPVGIAREIGEHRLRPGKGRLGIDHPALSTSWRKVMDEGTPVSEPCHLAEEGKLSGGVQVVGIFPNEDAIIRLVGAILLEQNDVYGPLPVCKGNSNVAADTVLAVVYPASVREPFGRRP
jgi:hypothetical protein